MEDVTRSITNINIFAVDPNSPNVRDGWDYGKEREVPGFVSFVNRYNALLETESFTQLKESVESIGLLEPIGVLKVEHDPYEFQLIYGFHRITACEDLGIENIPAVVYENLEPADIIVMQVTENHQREKLPLRAFAEAVEILQGSGLTQNKIAGKLNVSQGYVSNCLLLKYLISEVPEIESFVDEGTLGLQLIREFATLLKAASDRDGKQLSSTQEQKHLKNIVKVFITEITQDKSQRQRTVEQVMDAIRIFKKRYGLAKLQDLETGTPPEIVPVEREFSSKVVVRSIQKYTAKTEWIEKLTLEERENLKHQIENLLELLA